MKIILAMCVVLLLAACDKPVNDTKVGSPTGQTGKMVIAPQFADAGAFSEGLAPVQIGSPVNGKWGFLDKQGNVVIEPKFSVAERFTDGLARVWVKEADTEKVGFIDKQGRVVIPPRYDQADWFSEGLASVWVKRGNIFYAGYIDKKGHEIIPLQFDSAHPFSEGLALVRIGNSDAGKWGYIDKQGKMVIEPTFVKAESFSEGLAAVVFEDGSGFIDKTGSIIIKRPGELVSNFSEGLASVISFDPPNSDKIGYMNKQGVMTIPPRKLATVRPFSNGLAAVSDDPGDEEEIKWGVVNKGGKMVIPQKYRMSPLSKGFSEGLAPVVFGGKWPNWQEGYIDKDGKVVIEPQFNEARWFSDGMAAVRIGSGNNAKWGYIAR